MVRLLLIRHGSVPANEERRYIGKTDEHLSEKGREEVTILHDSGELPDPGLVFASPMKRCLETSEILFPGREPVVVPEFREIDFGAFEGKNAEELLADRGSGYQEWIDSGGAMTFPGGEARTDFEKRCREGFEKMMGVILAAATGGSHQKSGMSDRSLQPCGAPEGRLQIPGDEESAPFCAAAVVHGGTMMSILPVLCGGSYYDYMCRNGEGYDVTVQEGKTVWIGMDLKKITGHQSASEEEP